MNAPLIQPLYDEVQHGTWSTLYRRQRENLEGKGARLYLDALDRMEAPSEAARDDGACPICLSFPMWRPHRFTGCGHVFCFGCASREVDARGRCPLDRLPATRAALAGRAHVRVRRETARCERGGRDRLCSCAGGALARPPGKGRRGNRRAAARRRVSR